MPSKLLKSQESQNNLSGLLSEYSSPALSFFSDKNKENQGSLQFLIRKQREWLRSVYGCRSLSYCGSGLMPEAIQVRMSAIGGRIRTNGTLFCRSPRCARCSKILSKERAVKITRVLCSDETEDLTPFFVTLTFQSFAGSALTQSQAEAQIDRFNQIWRRSQKTKKFLPKLSLSVVEVTHGQMSNMHIHAHVLGFYDDSMSPEKTVDCWLSSARKEGVVALASSQNVKKVCLENKARLAAYLAKGSTVAGIALEMQGSEWKFGTLASLLSGKNGSVEHQAYCAMMPALVSRKLRTWRTSKAFRELLGRLELKIDGSSVEKEAIEIEADATLLIPAGAWKDSNRFPLPSSLRGRWRFTVRDLLEDLLLTGDVFLAEDIVSLLSKHSHYAAHVSRKEYQKQLWLELESLLL